MSMKNINKSISPTEFAGLGLSAQIDLLRGSDARRKSRMILNSDDGERLMAKLSVQEVYLMLKEIGPEQLPELAALASGEQWTGFIDLDCWVGDRFVSKKARDWVTVLLMAEEAEIVAKLLTINFETLVLLLKQEVEVLSGPEEIDDEDVRQEAVQHNGGYKLEFNDDEGELLFGGLLSVLFRNDPGFFRYLVEAVRGEMLSMVEENVYQQRGKRLMDLGFPEPGDAMAVYAWSDPETFMADQPQKFPMGVSDQGLAPGFPLVLSVPTGLLAAVMAEGVGEETAWEMATLVNRVTLADKVSLSDIDKVRGVIQKVNDTLNLALEWLAGSDLVAAGKQIAENYVQDLFRLGFNLTVRLQRRARKLLDTSIGPFIDEPFRTCLAALSQPVPLFHAALEDPYGEETRSFVHVEQLQLATACLEQVEVQQRLVEEQRLFSLPTARPNAESDNPTARFDRLTLSTLFLTALANRLLGRNFAATPLAAEELAGLHGMVTRNGRLRPELLQEISLWLEGMVPGGQDFATFSLAIWEDDFCAVRPEDLDTRFIEGLLIKES